MQASVDGYFVWFPVLAVVKSPEMNIVGPLTFEKGHLCFIYMPKSGIAVYYSGSLSFFFFFFFFLIYLDPVVQSYGTRLHGNPHFWRAPSSQHFPLDLFIVDLLMPFGQVSGGTSE